MKNKKRLLIISLILLLAVLGIGWWRGGQDAAAQAPEGEIVTAFIGDLSASANASGNVAAQTTAALSLETSGRVTAVPVQVGDVVEVGDVLVQLDTAALERAVANVEQALAIQQANLDDLLAGASAADIVAAAASVASAEANLADLQNGPSATDTAAAEANVRAAVANVWAAQEQLNQLSAGASAADVAAAEADLLAARVAYDNLAEAYDNIINGCFTLPDGSEVCPGYGATEEQTRFSLAAAEASLALARAQYDALLAGADSNQIANARANVDAAVARQEAAQAQLDLLLAGATPAQIAAAEAALAQAEANLAKLQDGATKEQIAIAEAQVTQAQINLERARLDLQKATLTAPFAGVVTAVTVSVGEFASGPAIQMAASGSLEAVLQVDEVDLANLAVGQTAVVTLEAWPDVEIASEISAIEPKASSSAAIVSYPVHLSLNTDLPVRVGMTANANFITANREGALLVANAAITANRSNGSYFVRLVQPGPDGDAVLEVPVTIGLRDGQYTQVLDGLQAGDQLLISEITATSSEDEGGFLPEPPPGGRPFGQ